MWVYHFFQEFYDKKICIEEEYKLDINYSIIRCKKESFESKIKTFPTLHLYNRAMQNVFELTYEDLFLTVGDYTYFLVIFRKGKMTELNQTWKLGIPFLKKNQIIFNSDTKRIGFYTENKVNIVGDKNPNNKKKVDKNKKDESKGFFDSIINSISLRTFFEIIIAILFIVVLIYLGKKLYNFRNKQKKPYELQDEDYDYFSNNSENKRKKDNIDINNSSNDNNALTGQIIEMKSH